MRPDDFPAVDNRAVTPETGTEMIRGEIRPVLPAEPPHADRQCDIAFVLRSMVAPGYVASTELLTRADDESDFATDVCIRKAGQDPATGSRYLEEIAFEVEHDQNNADITERARKLVRRGVRRVFVIPVQEKPDGVVEAGPVKEWLAGENRWQALDPQAEIVDRCLVLPLEVQALTDGNAANNQVARVLLAQGNPVLVKARQQALDAHAEAHAQRMQALDAEHARRMQALEDAAYTRSVILDLCEVLDIEVTGERRACLDAMSQEELDALRSTIRTRHCWPEE